MARNKPVLDEAESVKEVEVVAEVVAETPKYLSFAEVQAILRKKQNETSN